MSITTNKSRVGNFTSSEISALLKEPTAAEKKAGAIFGKAALTYITKCNYERRLGRSLSDEIEARPLTWGHLLERRAFKLLPSDYSLNSDDTIVHPDYNFWAGSPDGFKYDEGKTVNDKKCPMTLLSFCQLVDPLYNGLTGMAAMNVIRATHKKGEDYYQQLVSNSCITQSRFAELIVYMPFKSELDEIKSMAEDGQGKHFWIQFAEEGALPFLPDNGYYKNLNIIRFEVPNQDKDLLTERVEKAGELLIPFPSSTLLASSIEGGILIEQA